MMATLFTKNPAAAAPVHAEVSTPQSMYDNVVKGITATLAHRVLILKPHISRDVLENLPNSYVHTVCAHVNSSKITDPVKIPSSTASIIRPREAPNAIAENSGAGSRHTRRSIGEIKGPLPYLLYSVVVSIYCQQVKQCNIIVT